MIIVCNGWIKCGYNVEKYVDELNFPWVKPASQFSYYLQFYNCNKFTLQFAKCEAIIRTLNYIISSLHLWKRNNNLRGCELQIRIQYLGYCIYYITLPVPYISGSCSKTKIYLNFYFHTSLWRLKGFMKAFKVFIKPFEAPQRSVKIKIYVNFSLSGNRTGRAERPFSNKRPPFH